MWKLFLRGPLGHPAFQLFQGFQVTYIENPAAPAADHFTFIGPAAAPSFQPGPAIRTFQVFSAVRWSFIIHWSVSFCHLFDNLKG
jgi:hypothetical protein